MQPTTHNGLSHATHILVEFSLAMTLSYISVYILLPPPLILICLLLVPLPKFAQSVLLKGIKSVLFVRVLSHLALCHVMLAASAYSLGTTARQVGLLRSQLEDKGQVTTPAARMEKLAKIWCVLCLLSYPMPHVSVCLGKLHP